MYSDRTVRELRTQITISLACQRSWGSGPTPWWHCEKQSSTVYPPLIVSPWRAIPIFSRFTATQNLDDCCNKPSSTPRQHSNRGRSPCKCPGCEAAMDKLQQWQKVREIVGSALERPLAERSSVLDE